MPNQEREYTLTQTELEKIVAAVKVAEEVRGVSNKLNLKKHLGNIHESSRKSLNQARKDLDQARKYLDQLPDRVAILHHATVLGKYNLAGRKDLVESYNALLMVAGRGDKGFISS